MRAKLEYALDYCFVSYQVFFLFEKAELETSYNTIHDTDPLLSQPAWCGNGIVEEGEQCDEGVAVNTTSRCCTSKCRLTPLVRSVSDLQGYCNREIWVTVMSCPIVRPSVLPSTTAVTMSVTSLRRVISA